MDNLWTYRSGVALTDRDLVGYDVEASDGHIGKVDEATRETDRDHLVVDTGFWIFGKKRLIPAGVATRVDYDNEKVYVNMSKDQIKDAPDWDADWDTDLGRRDSYSEYYAPFGW
jgi:hypothetical protein